MKFSEVKDMNKEELKKRIKEMSEELFELKMKHSLGQVSNPLKIRDVRRNMAKIKTALSQSK
jgi:large subunit ribosomal protein L29